MAFAMVLYMSRCSGVQAFAGIDASRSAHLTAVDSALYSLVILAHPSQVGSSVMILTGPSSFSLAKPEAGPPVFSSLEPFSASGRTTSTVTTTASAIAKTTARPPSIHLTLPPPLGGVGPLAHCGCGPHGGGPAGGGDVGPPGYCGQDSGEPPPECPPRGGCCPNEPGGGGKVIGTPSNQSRNWSQHNRRITGHWTRHGAVRTWPPLRMSGFWFRCRSPWDL